MGRKQSLLAGKIGGVLVLAAIAIWVVWSMSAYQTRTQVLSEQLAERAERSANVIESACSELAGSPLVDCLTRQIEDSRAERRAEYDLSAQDRMATWAFWMFIATAATVMIGVAGVILIWRTLVHTARAATHTAGMLEEAKATTAAAKAAVDVSRESLATQDRAWLQLSVSLAAPLKFGSEKITTEIDIIAKNVGKAPAVDVNILFASLFPDSSAAQDEVSQRTRFMPSIKGFSLGLSSVTIFPNDDHKFEYGAEMSVADFRKSAAEWASFAADEGWEDPSPNCLPAILAGVTYGLPGSTKTRMTVVGFHILKTGKGGRAIDGSEGTISPGRLDLQPIGGLAKAT